MMERHITKEVQIGNRWIGGNHPIAIQSMTNTKTEDVAATVAQIKQLTKVGCEIIRCAVPTQEAAAALTEIKNRLPSRWLRISILITGLRLQPWSTVRIKFVSIPETLEVVSVKSGCGCGKRAPDSYPCGRQQRIFREGSRGKIPWCDRRGIVESAMDKVKLIEDMGYDNLVISIKSSDVMMCVKAHELIAKQTDHPLHVGITEAGTLISGNIKSAIGLGLILNQGIRGYHPCFSDRGSVGRD